MRYLAATALLSAIGLGVLWTSGSASEKPATKTPHGATIVLQGDAPGEVECILIHDKADLAKLARFFPNYARRPASDIAAGWELGATVYFDFPYGEAVRVGVASRGNGGNLWSTGRGDFDVRGDFYSFVESLKKSD